jgi:hypothetical protein
MKPVSSQGGHSAVVKIQLLLNGTVLPVAQLGPDFLLLDAPSDHPPGSARLVLQVDQSERSWEVSLPHGIAASSERVLIAAQA